MIPEPAASAASAAILSQAILSKATALDAADPLAAYRDAFVDSDTVVAYLDGNSLGRPLRVTGAHLAGFVDGQWGSRLIRAWDEDWMERPLALATASAGRCSARATARPSSATPPR